jgi:hypothetical protein
LKQIHRAWYTTFRVPLLEWKDRPCAQSKGFFLAMRFRLGLMFSCNIGGVPNGSALPPSRSRLSKSRPYAAHNRDATIYTVSRHWDNRPALVLVDSLTEKADVPIHSGRKSKSIWKLSALTSYMSARRTDAGIAGQHPDREHSISHTRAECAGNRRPEDSRRGP